VDRDSCCSILDRRARNYGVATVYLGLEERIASR
jgi:hypothetical protein